MEFSLDAFVAKVPDFSSLSDPEKIKHFAWFIHRSLGRDRWMTRDIRSCYDALHAGAPNISENLSRLSARRPRVLLKDGKGYYLEGKVRQALDAQYLAFFKEKPIHVTDDLLPDSIVKGTRPYIEKLSHQINGCYQYKFYDGCAVLMRRLVESLLIEAFEKAGHGDKIRTGKEYMMLNGIITIAKNGQYIRLARGSDRILDDIKYVGDRAAHSRTYVSSLNDVKDLILRFRTIITELLHLADIHPK